jgi:hypothetical protein
MPKRVTLKQLLAEQGRARSLPESVRHLDLDLSAPADRADPARLVLHSPSS